MVRKTDSEKDAEITEFDAVVEEFLSEIRDSNDKSAVETFCESYPHLAEDIRRLFPLLTLLEGNDTVLQGNSSATQIDFHSESSLTHRSSMLDSLALLESQPFGRYQLETELGRGNMGTVFLAHDTKLHRKVALKVSVFPKTHENAINRFRREAMAMALLEHPNLCSIYDVGEFEDYNYISMRYIQGKTLEQLIVQFGKLSPQHAATIICELAKALSEIHRAGLLHRDIKPSNIMIAEDGTPFLMDLGLAHMESSVDAKLTQAGEIIGSPAYLPPEKIEPELGDVRPQSDLYSLGIVLFESIAGQRPFVGTPFRVMRQVITDKAPKLSSVETGISSKLDRLCAKLLEKKPKDRISSADQLVTELTPLLGGSQFQNTQIGRTAVFAVVLLALFAFSITYIPSFFPNGNGHQTANKTENSQDKKNDTYSKIGDSKFTPALGNFPGHVRAVELGDLDGDGDLDAFAARYDSKLGVMMNRGDGNFDEGPSIPDPDDWRNWEVALGDVDGDGDLDAFVTKNGSDRLWLNKGDGTFFDSQQQFGTRESNQALLADLDDDGDLDLFVTENGQCVLWKNEKGKFSKTDHQFGTGNFYSCKAGDLDGDGDLDLVVGTVGGSANQIWINQGNCQFVIHPEELGNSSPWDIELADWDKDDDLDIFLGNADGPIDVYQNNGKGQFTLVAQSSVTRETHGVRLFDVDQDGDLDVFESNNGTGENDAIWLSEGTKLFVKQLKIPTIRGERCEIGDLDSDGDIDIFGNRPWLNQ